MVSYGDVRYGMKWQGRRGEAWRDEVVYGEQRLGRVRQERYGAVR